MNNMPPFIVVCRSSNSFEIMMLNNNSKLYTLFAECEKEYNALYIVQALTKYVE